MGLLFLFFRKLHSFGTVLPSPEDAMNSFVPDGDKIRAFLPFSLKKTSPTAQTASKTSSAKQGRQLPPPSPSKSSSKSVFREARFRGGRPQSAVAVVATALSVFPVMLKRVSTSLSAFVVLASKIWAFVVYVFKKQTRAIIQHKTIQYNVYPLSPLSRHRLSLVRRKVLVLDLDETLIHSHHDGVLRQTVKPGTPPDFVLKVTIDRHPVRFFVHKRPHVDFFLDVVSQWYELVVFTASMEIYGTAVADKLDKEKGILRRRYYRQHCTLDFGSYTKDLSAICPDLASVFILDNSPGAYRSYPDNAIPIKSWFNDPSDTALLNLLPILDALRFVSDVRSVLSRNRHSH